MPLRHLGGYIHFTPLIIIILANDVIILANERFKAVKDVLSLMWVLGLGEVESTKSHYFYPNIINLAIASHGST